MEKVTFNYKGALVAIVFREPKQQHTVEIAPKSLDERIERELLPMIFYYVRQYNATGKVPPLEDAKIYSAHVCIGGEAFGNLTQWSIEDLAREAGVTEEFALYRISLIVQKN